MSAPENHDPLLAALAELPVPPLDQLTSERIRRAARAVLEEERQRREQPGLVQRLWSRAVMPAVVAATVCVYFGWAVQTAAALYR